eukprot:346473-Prorocentrum_minimum.AAC.7
MIGVNLCGPTSIAAVQLFNKLPQVRAHTHARARLRNRSPSRNHHIRPHPHTPPPQHSTLKLAHAACRLSLLAPTGARAATHPTSYLPSFTRSSPLPT